MNLLMISGDRLAVQGKKGAFWYTLEELCKHWDRIDVICPHVERPLPSLHGTVFFHPSPGGLWSQPWWILSRGTSLIKEHHCTVMTVHEYPPFYNGIGAGWLSRRTGIPYVLEIHHIVGYPKPSSLPEVIGFFLSRWYLPHEIKKISKVRIINNEVDRVLKRWGVPEEKLEIISSAYLDLDVLVSDSTIHKQYDFAFCARLVPNKGALELINSIAEIPNATLIIIGDGPDRSLLKKRVDVLGLENRVTFTGWISNNRDVYRTMQQAKIFVMNSKSEGGPRTALEAMALGLPIITTRVGVMPQLNDNTVMYTDGSHRDLVEKMNLLLQNESLRKELGRKATVIRSVYNRPRMIEMYANYLKSVS